MLNDCLDALLVIYKIGFFTKEEDEFIDELFEDIFNKLEAMTRVIVCPDTYLVDKSILEGKDMSFKMFWVCVHNKLAKIRKIVREGKYHE